MGRGWWFLLYLVVFFGVQFLVALGIYYMSPNDGEHAAEGAGALIALGYFAWAMPRTGRTSWWALGLYVPILNLYLFFSNALALGRSAYR